MDGFAVTVVIVPTKLTRRVYNGAMETDKRPAVLLQNIHAGFSLTVELCLKDLVTFSLDGIGRQEAGDEEALLSKDEAVEECRKLQQCLEDALGCLLRVLIYPPKVQPKYLEKRKNWIAQGKCKLMMRLKRRLKIPTRQRSQSLLMLSKVKMEMQGRMQSLEEVLLTLTVMMNMMKLKSI